VNATGAALIVGVLGLDQTAVAQVLFSQPLVGGVILGWSVGDPGSGLLAGAFFQFLCLTDLPVGASIPPDTALAGLIGVATFLVLGHPPGWGDQALLGLLAAGFLPVAILARVLDVRVRRANRIWLPLTGKLLEQGRMRLAQAAAIGGLLFFFLRAFIFSLVVLNAVALWNGTGLDLAAGAAPAFALFARCVPLIGLAALLAQRQRPGWPLSLTAGIAAGILFTQSAA
jgi:mannose/fructose/N-acetylgalactosamine-specific phosphotransferase system component IIC